jgi:cytochrome c
MKMTVLFALALLGGCAGQSAMNGASDTQRIERGREVAQAHCGSCHALGASGDSPAPEAPPFRNLSQSFRVATLEDALTRGISTGHPVMPEIQLPQRDVHALVVYLQSMQQTPPPSTP